MHVPPFTSIFSYPPIKWAQTHRVHWATQRLYKVVELQTTVKQGLGNSEKNPDKPCSPALFLLIRLLDCKDKAFKITPIGGYMECMAEVDKMDGFSSWTN